MKCPRCQHENPTGTNFCGQCAAPLAATCPSCGATNPPGNKFCGQCATPLLTTPPTKSPAPDSYTPKHLAEKILTSRAALEGERKQVTVLFADLKGWRPDAAGGAGEPMILTARFTFHEMHAASIAEAWRRLCQGIEPTPAVAFGPEYREPRPRADSFSWLPDVLDYLDGLNRGAICGLLGQQ